MLRAFANYQKISELNRTIENEEKKEEETSNKFEDEGILYKGKLIGMEDLTIDQDEATCLEAINRLKTSVKVRGEHKQKVQLKFSLNGIQIIDESTKVELVRHPIRGISYVIMDPVETRVFGYIFNTNDQRHQFWAIKMDRPAQSAVLILKGLFDEMFQHITDAENKQNEIMLESASLFDDTWGGNLPKIGSRTAEQQSNFDADPWGFSESSAVVEKPVVRAESPVPLVSLPPPPTPLTRRITTTTTTTQPSSSTATSNEFFSSLITNESFNPSTVLKPQQQQQLNLFDSMAVLSNTSSTVPNASNEFDLFANYSSDPASTRRTEDLFFS